MKLKITAGYAVAFAALVVVVKELHELSHIVPGRLICGCWGAFRDFNLISFCEPCMQENPLILLASFGGPLFTYLCMWTGLWLMLKPAINLKWLGFTLLFANKPFARLFTALVGGGDEFGALRQILSESISQQSIQLITVLAILAIILPPLIVACKNIGNKYKLVWFTGFFLLPMLFDFVFVMGFLNSLLQKGVLSEPFIFATPWLVHVVFWASILLLFTFRKHLLVHPFNLKSAKATAAGASIA
ncbi:hypothetical protein [Pontibacter sp. H249]|uniref:hypothetical protein n=1 Tax=Pontibacter sp. H249 TaxID=3133420 RepID=UPI0030C52DCF